MKFTLLRLQTFFESFLLIAYVLDLSELVHILYLCYFSNMLCMVDALGGCDEDVQNTLLQNIGSQSMDNVHNLIQMLEC